MKSTIKQAVLVLVASISVLSLTPASASAHSYDKHWSDEPNIVETAVGINQQTGEFSTLIAAVSCTNLVNRLQNENREYTVFAPTDAAFAKLGLNADNICSSFDKRTLRNILKYHIARCEYTAADVLATDSITMLNYEEAPVSGATIAGQNIVKTDVKASNGIIHVIDGVMMPAAE